MFGIFKRKRNLDTNQEVVVKKEQEKEQEVVSSEFNYYIKNDLKVCYNLGVGDEVIVVSNEPNGVFRAVISRFDRITKARKIIPIVDDGTKEYMTMGILIPFDQEMYDKLISLSTDVSAWNYISPSWCQSGRGTQYRKTENSIYKF